MDDQWWLEHERSLWGSSGNKEEHPYPEPWTQSLKEDFVPCRPPRLIQKCKYQCQVAC